LGYWDIKIPSLDKEGRGWLEIKILETGNWKLETGN